MGQTESMEVQREVWGRGAVAVFGESCTDKQHKHSFVCCVEAKKCPASIRRSNSLLVAGHRVGEQKTRTHPMPGTSG